MKLLTGLFRASRKRLMTTDNDMGMFRDKLNELVAQKDSLSDEEVNAKVEELKAITNDLPDDEGKAKLLRFLEDFKAVKEQDQKVAEEAAAQVAEQFEKLDTAAMQDVPGVEEPAAEETVTETVEEEGSAEEVPAEETAAEEIAEETVAPETEEETGDADPNAEYTLEEIYQFIKKRMAEDSAEVEETTEEEEISDDGEELEGEDLINSLTEPEEETKDECEEEEVVTDHAPRIPVTVNDNAAKGSLSALFELAKRGNN